MKGVRELRRRLRSVRNIQKITKAMELVAATKLRRLQERALASRPYAEGIDRLIRRVASRIDPSASPLFSPPAAAASQELLIVVGADKGLCGSFNSNLFRRAVQELRTREAAGRATTLYIVGRRPLQFFRKVRCDIHDFCPDTVEKIEYRRVREILGDILRAWGEGRFRSVAVLFTRGRSAVTSAPVMRELLPIPREEAPAGGASSSSGDYLLEPEPREILDRLLPRFLEMQLYAAVRESLAAEFAARRAAMKSATDNAKEVIGILTQEYNKARQTGITAELIEIVSGAEALAG